MFKALNMMRLLSSLHPWLFKADRSFEVVFQQEAKAFVCYVKDRQHFGIITAPTVKIFIDRCLEI